MQSCLTRVACREIRLTNWWHAEARCNEAFVHCVGLLDAGMSLRNFRNALDCRTAGDSEYTQAPGTGHCCVLTLRTASEFVRKALAWLAKFMAASGIFDRVDGWT